MTWLGLAIRVWAVVALGAAFRTTVEVDDEQPVVSTGPYRWVRHPSYTGLLLIVIGFGLASGRWYALVLSVVLPLPALLWRIQRRGSRADARARRPLRGLSGAHQAADPRGLVT